MFMPEMTMPIVEGVSGGRYDDDYHVSVLNLTNNNVHGVLPREVFTAFARLTSLDVSRNALGGTIGGEVGSLLELEGRFVFFIATLSSGSV
jgi:hypothetical protein